MKTLLAIKGNEDETWFGRVARVAALASADEVLLVHVVDVGPKHGVAQGRERYLGRRPLGGDRLTGLMQLEDEAAARALSLARQALEGVGVEEHRLREALLHGKPNEVIRDFAETEDVDLIVVGGRQGKPGPHSVGKAARFLIDHTSRAALLVR